MSNFRVATNSIQESLIQQLNNSQRNMVSLQKQLATGRKVSNPADDAFAFGRTVRREATKTSLEQYYTNNLMAQGLMKTSLSHLEQMRKLSDLAIGITDSTGNATSDAEIDGYYSQLSEILDQALDIANAQHEGEYLFAGVNYANPPYTIHDNGTPANKSDDTTIVYNGSPTDRTNPNFAEAETYVGKNTKIAAHLNPEHNEDIQSMLQSLLDLRNAYDRTIAPYNSPAVKAVVEKIETADNNLLIASSDIVTKQMRLEIATTSDKKLYSQLDEMISNEVEADITEVAVKIKQIENSYNASLSSASRILNTSLLNYL